MNRIEDADIPNRLGSVIIAALKIHPKSVWLCSSDLQAHKFQHAVSLWLNQNGLVGHPTWLLTPLGDEIDQFKTSPKGHLFVAGRFDGMDFQADECRLVILTTLPRAINTQEEFLSAYLRDSGFMRKRLNQRIIQALGRCNRSDEDYGVYILADRRFASHFGRESNKEGFSKNLVTEIDMAQDDAEILEDLLIKKVEKFLRGDFKDYDKELEEYMQEVPDTTDTLAVVDTSADEVIGWASLFGSQNYEIAADRFEKCWETTRGANLREICALYGWQWAKALYLQSLSHEPTARERSLIILEEAINRGGMSSWFNRMRASLNRAKNTTQANEELVRIEYSIHLIRTFDDLLERLGTTGNKFERWCNDITSLLQSESHAQYQEGLEKLGMVLGYYALRPQYASATDCIWRGVFANIREIVTFEAKVEQSSSSEISANYVGQAHNQYTRAVSEYASLGYSVRGTIVTHLSTLTPDADASIGNIKIISKVAVFALWEKVRTLLSVYRDNWSLYNISARNIAANPIRRQIPSTNWLIQTIDEATDPFITVEKLLTKWP